MWGSRELLLVWFLVLAAGGTEHVYRPGRRVCVVGVPRGPVSESFVQRVYQPFLTTCDGYRACSTYRTIYRTAYRRSPGPAPARPRYACCPGWKRTSGLPGACGAAICHPPCQNGGSCVRPGRCHCPAGWRGDTCQTGEAGSHFPGGGLQAPPCTGSWRVERGLSVAPPLPDTTFPQMWMNAVLEGAAVPSTVSTPQAVTGVTVRRGTAHLWTGHSACPGEGPPGWPQTPQQKLQLVLAPLHSLASRALEHGLPDPGSLLAHSLQQLDRIDSLSEQISLLEEQLGSCSCKKEL
uniref:Epidermal growth factor-like protein 7 n=1 Tax=Sus scrofa TaxID=9823 RepID=A0A4X1SEZ7_PIG